MFTQCPLSLIDVIDAQDYRQLDLPFLQAAQELILQHDVQAIVLPQGRGLGRFLNLIHYNLDAPVEYVDQACIFGDQLIHLAAHLKAKPLFAQPTSAAVLASESLASCFDLLLLGQFAQKGLEPEFLQHHLESISYYFDCYENPKMPYRKWLAQLLDDPFSCMRSTVLFLFDFCQAVGKARDHLDLLNQATQFIGYPLSHHFNCANWILFAQQLEPGNADEARAGLEALLQSETQLANWFIPSH